MPITPEWLDHQLEKGMYTQRASDEFYVATGLFITKFADAERGKRLLAINYSGISEDRGRVAFGNMDFVELKRLVPALSRLIHNAELSEEIDKLFQHLHILHDLRNQVLRARISFPGEQHVAVYVPAGRTIGEALEGAIAPDEMNKMAADCELIRSYFELMVRPDVSPSDIEAVRSPWNYEAS